MSMTELIRDEQNATQIEPSVKRTKDLTPEESRQLIQLYHDLGQAYYEGAFEDPLPQLLPLFDQITELLRVEEEPENVCPKCGAPIEEDAVFCESCGARLIEEEPQEPEVPVENYCPNCGNRLGENAKFCGKCGTRVML